jgi:hypothetical protein
MQVCRYDVSEYTNAVILMRAAVGAVSKRSVARSVAALPGQHPVTTTHC